MDLLSIGSPSAPSSSSTVDILSLSASNIAPASSLDDLSPHPPSSRATSNAGSMMDLLGGISSSSATGCIPFYNLGIIIILNIVVVLIPPPFLILNRKQWTSLPICNCF